MYSGNFCIKMLLKLVLTASESERQIKTRLKMQEDI